MRPQIQSIFALKRPRIALYGQIGPLSISTFLAFYGDYSIGMEGMFPAGSIHVVKRCFPEVRETLRWTLRWTNSCKKIAE